MSGPTKIEWADASWNPVTGCSKVSVGCAHCYAERQAKRFAGRAGYPKRNPFAVTLHPDRLDEPLHWRKPRRILLCSMGDLFHPDVPDQLIAHIFAVCWDTPRHTYQILTKRPERMAELTNSGRFWRAVRAWLKGNLLQLADDQPLSEDIMALVNVWLGTSIEDQPTAEERIIHLLRCPAAVRFVSYEPALGPVNFMRLSIGTLGMSHPPDGGYHEVAFGKRLTPNVDWVIAGGESGPKARPAHPDWFRSVRDRCQAAGVPFFFKQWGEWSPVGTTPAEPESLVCQCGARSCGSDWRVWLRAHRERCRLDQTVVRRVGKKAAGRLLDGVEHNAYAGGGEPVL